MGKEFYLNPNTVKTECDEGISACIKGTSSVVSVINAYNEIRNNVDIKCSGFESEKKLAEDMDAYFSMVNAMITDYQNSYFKLKNAVGDEILDSDELQDSFNLLTTVSMNFGTSFKSCFNTATKSLEGILGKSYSAHRQQLMQQTQNLNDKIDEAKYIIGQKIEKYEQIENATKGLFATGNQYKATAEKILASVNNGNVKDGEYTQEKNTSWRKEYNSYLKQLDKLYDERNDLYFQSKDLTKDQVQKYTKYNYCKEDDLYDVLTKIEENDDKKRTSLNCAVNIIKGNYKAAFKGIKADDLNKYARKLVQTNGFNKYFRFNSNINDTEAEKELENYYNAMLDDGVTRTNEEAYARSKSFIELMRQGAEDTYKELLSKTVYICEKDEGNNYKSKITQNAVKALEKSKSFIMFNDGIFANFKEKKFEGKVDSLPNNPFGPYILSSSIYEWPKKITNISYPDKADINDNKVDNVVIHMDVYNSDVWNACKTKNIKVVEKYYHSKAAVDNEIRIGNIEAELKEGPHAVKDWGEKTINNMVVAGATAVDPVYGVFADMLISSYGKNMDKDKALESASEVYDIFDDVLNINKRVKDMSKKPFEGVGSSVSRIPGVLRLRNSTALSRAVGVSKGMVGDILNTESLGGLLAAIEEDKNFGKNKRKELAEALRENTKTYITSSVDDGKEYYREFSGDLASEVAYKKLKKGSLTARQQENLKTYIIDNVKAPERDKDFKYWFIHNNEEKVYNLKVEEIQKIAQKGVKKDMSDKELTKYIEVCRLVEKYLNLNPSDTLLEQVKKEKDEIEEKLGLN
ncbi:hypothetical protein [Lachnobacterium bovis]|uniref:hypothetical protein n=1 Tax=Lachnobacterium bovis TaxID=140626 RepID=UPI00048B0ABF|nr:hypothetical protein [Lachnobacterium bovis]